MNKRLILLNGGIGCGKTDAVKFLKTKITDLQERKCKDKLHELTMAFFNVDPDTYWSIYENRELKETPLPDFSISKLAFQQLSLRLGYGIFSDRGSSEMVDISIREAMIYVSECLCKPTFGEEYFGVARINCMEEGEIAVDDSTGFEEELHPAVRMLGQDNILLIRIHGRGNFDNDSRDYIRDGVITNTVDINNTGTLEEYLEAVGEAVATRFFPDGL